jgi:Flp pilus assembly protein TadB
MCNPEYKDKIRKQHSQPEKGKRKKLRNILNTAFILLVCMTIVFYFVLPTTGGTPFYMICCFVALIVKAAEVSMRFSGQKHNSKTTNYNE